MKFLPRELVLTTVRTANRTVRFAHKPNRAQPPRFGSPNRHGLHGLRTAAVHHGSSRFAIFFHAIFTHSHIKSASHLALHSRTMFSDNRIVAAFHLAPHSRTRCLRTIAFSLHLPPLCILPRRPSPPFSRTIAFFQLLLTLSIRWSHFGSFCSLHSRTPPLPPVLAYDRIFAAFAHSAFDGRILAAFALSPHSRTPPLPPVLLNNRILAAFAVFQHSTVALWQLLLTFSIRRSHFGSFCSLRILPRRP